MVNTATAILAPHADILLLPLPRARAACLGPKHLLEEGTEILRPAVSGSCIGTLAEVMLLAPVGRRTKLLALRIGCAQFVVRLALFGIAENLVGLIDVLNCASAPGSLLISG